MWFTQISQNAVYHLKLVKFGKNGDTMVVSVDISAQQNFSDYYGRYYQQRWER